MTIPWPGYSALDVRYVNVTGDEMSGQLVNTVSIRTPEIIGSDQASGSLKLTSTSNNTKGSIQLGQSLYIDADGSAVGNSSFGVIRWIGGSRLYEQEGGGDPARFFYTPNGDRFELLNEAGNLFIAGFHGPNSALASRIVFYYGVTIGYTNIAPPTSGLIVSGPLGAGSSAPDSNYGATIQKTSTNTVLKIIGNNNFGSIQLHTTGGTQMVILGYESAAGGGWINGSLAQSVSLRGLGGVTLGQGTTRLATFDTTGGLKLNALRLQQALGTSVASANEMTLSSNGNTFFITGSTQINGIATANWQAGAWIVMSFNLALTVKHNTAVGAGFARIYLYGSADFITASGDILFLFYDGSVWREIARSVT